MGRSLRLELLPLCYLLVACASAGPLPAKGRVPVSPKPEPASAVARLARALRSIPRPPGVLLALSDAARARLATRLANLDPERNLAIHDEQSPLVESLPLLHLASGGASARALFALATSPAGAQELSGLLGDEASQNSTPPAARVAMVGDLARRAALAFLRDRAADLALANKATPLVCRLIARAALAVERSDLVLLSHEVLSEAEPSAENKLLFALDLARSAEPERAARVLSGARADRAHAPTPAASEPVERAIVAARFVLHSALEPSDSTTLSRARGWLRLGRLAEARALLEPAAAALPGHLGLAGALAEASIAAPTCPDLPLDVGTPSLCAAAFHASDRVSSSLARLSVAWAGGLGRDDEAIEVYAAFTVVIPFLQRQFAAPEASPNALEPAAMLHEKAAELVTASPRLTGLALFLDALSSTLHEKPVPSAEPGNSEAQALRARALRLVSAGDSSRFAQAGVLSVAAVLSREQDVSALLAALPADRTVPSLRLPRAALSVWLAASLGDRARMDAARSELSTIMTEGRGSSFERARLVLDVSEADALLDGSERSYRLLSRVAGQLLADNVPPDLAFRAVLDAAGALAHGARRKSGQEVLSRAATAHLPENLERARDLLTLVRGYELLLASEGGDAPSASRARAGLGELSSGADAESAKVWFELWDRELQAREREALCQKKGQTACREAQALRHTPRHVLDARLGTQASSVLLRGALPGGYFDAGVRFSAESGLEPFIVFEPTLLAIGLPSFSAD